VSQRGTGILTDGSRKLGSFISCLTTNYPVLHIQRRGKIYDARVVDNECVIAALASRARLIVGAILEGDAGGFAEADEGFLGEIEPFAAPMENAPVVASVPMMPRSALMASEVPFSNPGGVACL
jgi:hypothetical protein